WPTPRPATSGKGSVRSTRTSTFRTSIRSGSSRNTSGTTPRKSRKPKSPPCSTANALPSTTRPPESPRASAREHQHEQHQREQNDRPDDDRGRSDEQNQALHHRRSTEGTRQKRPARPRFPSMTPFA